MLTAVEAGAQAAFLAPAEILARQHYETLRTLRAGLPVNPAVLTGRDKGRAREATLMGLADGSIHVIGPPWCRARVSHYESISVATVTYNNSIDITRTTKTDK